MRRGVMLALAKIMGFGNDLTVLYNDRSHGDLTAGKYRYLYPIIVEMTSKLTLTS